MRKLFVLFVLALFSLGFAQYEDVDGSFVDALANDANYTILVDLLSQTGLLDVLAEGIAEGNVYTVFTPDNSAFRDLDDDVLAALTADQELLKRVLLSHVVPGMYNLTDLKDINAGDEVNALDGSFLDFDTTLFGFRINGADLASGNVENTYADGMTHGLHDVIISEELRDLLDN